MSLQAEPVLFVGAGPGDPELITLAGKKALERADLVVYAGSLVSREMLDWCPDGVTAVDSAGLTLEEIVRHLAAAHGRGEKVVRLHTGDPSLYGAIWEQMRLLRERGVPYKVIPGVSAAFAAAASIGLEFTLPEICQTLIFTRAAGRTPVPKTESLDSLAAHGASLAIYLSAGQAEQVSQTLSRHYGSTAPVCVAEKVSWPDERIIWTRAAELPRALAEAGIKKHALILAGPALAAVAGEGDSPASKLYDAGFSHGYRPAKGEE